MALKGVKGPDRVLYGVSALLQCKLPSKITAYNAEEKAETLFCLPDGAISFSTAFIWQYQIRNITYSINFGAGSYNLPLIKSVINDAEGPLTAYEFSKNALLLQSSESIKFLTAFGNIKAGQIVNFQPLVAPKTYIVSGQLPGEDQIKYFPAVVVELNGITPEADSIMVNYGVDITLAITSPINSSQADYLSNCCMKYYDCFSDCLLADDGSLGGLINGFSIDSASVDEASGNSYFLKLLTISLTCSVEED